MSDIAARAALERMNMREVAIAPHHTGLVADLRHLASLDPKVGHEGFLARRADLCAAYGVSAPQQDKPFAFANGVAVVPVHGSLINRFSGSWGSVTGYNFLKQQVALAGLDPDVELIVYDHNSFGGEAAGCFETVAELKLAANGKPTMAVIDSNCYSASYAIATAADQIVLTPSGGAGSIGVVAIHVSMAKALEDWGYEVTIIQSGDHKTDGNPYEALSPQVKKDIQAGVDKSRIAFAQLVADNRGMDLKAVMDTEARIYRADDALALGLIDAIATPSQAVQAYFAKLSGSRLSTTEMEISMSTETKPGEQAASTQVDTAKLAADAKSAERARISGIQSCEEAKGREALANHLALSTDMSLEAAKGILAAAPKTAEATSTPAAEGNPFKAAMDGGKHPNVGADGGAAAAGASGDQVPLHVQIIRAQELATGQKLLTQ